MAARGKEYNSTFMWTTAKGLLTIASFFVLALISEFVIVSFFTGSGVTDVTSSFPVSPLFHLLPLAVIVFLVLSWMYLTKNMIMKPYRTVPSKASKTRKRHSKRRTKSTRGVISSVKNFFSTIDAIFPSSSNVSATHCRLTFRGASLESGVTVLTIFLVSIILLSVLANPRLFTDFAIEFYSTTSPFQGFMQVLATALVPIASGLNSIASSFSKAFDGLVATQSLTGGDLLVRYIICQIAATLVSAVSVLIYVRFVIKAQRGRK